MLRLFVLCAGRARSGCRAASSSCGEHTLPLSAVASFCVWGSNTGVGKTLVSAGLAAHEAATGAAVLYVKPLQTGFPDDSDGAFLAQAVRHVAPASTVAHTLGGHAAATAADASAAAAAGGSAAPRGRAPLADAVPRVSARTLFAWHAAVGPHLAVAREGRAVADHEVSLAVAEELRNFARAYAGGRACAVGTTAERVGHALPLPPLVLVETAGGVSSPGPGGALQCDLLRSLRLPAVLVGDGRLGCAHARRCCLALRRWLALHAVPTRRL
jgi:dethiobiotin synthetase/adenosylmethionine--8-amino-7-oxononanoate aminotransferase